MVCLWVDWFLARAGGVLVVEDCHVDIFECSRHGISTFAAVAFLEQIEIAECSVGGCVSFWIKGES